MEERIEADLALGRHADLVGELEALVGEHPLHERFRGQLMLALYRSGRQAEALREYQDARRVLVDELGLDPSEELQRMERAILTHDPELDLQPGARVTAPAAAVPSPVPDRGAGLRPQRAAGAVPPDSVVVLDPEGTRVVGYVPVGRRPVAVAVGHGSVWVANADDATVSRVDPDTMAVARTIGIGGPPVDLAVGPDALWVATGSDGTVVRVDPDAEAVVETIDLRGSSDLVWNTTYALAVGSAGLWVAVGPRSLVRVDPATNETECTVDAGRVPVSIAIGAGTVWAVTIAGRALRIEPRTNGITAEATIAYPVDLAADDDAVWVADVLRAPVAHRSGHCRDRLHDPGRCRPVQHLLCRVRAMGSRQRGRKGLAHRSGERTGQRSSRDRSRPDRRRGGPRRDLGHGAERPGDLAPTRAPGARHDRRRSPRPPPRPGR